MSRRCAILALAWIAFSQACLACECSYASRPCEYLRSDAVFVGKVVETVAIKQPVGKNFWTSGYSMRFAVESWIRGGDGAEVTIETGSGAGDCGTPLPAGDRFLIFAYKEKDGQLRTGMCSGNFQLTTESSGDQIVEQLRKLAESGVSTIFGKVVSAKPAWNDRDRDIRDESEPQPVQDLSLHVQGEHSAASTKTAQDGSYEFDGLPPGKYTVVPEISGKLDFDHENEERYQADLRSGQCADISFRLEPSTRIRGHLALPSGVGSKHVEVEAIPTRWKELDQFSGKWDITGEDGTFDLWPLPPGDYYVGVNINSSPSADAPFPPTFYPGMTNKKDATVIHIKEGEVREIEFTIREVAQPRTVHFVAIGLDGKPLKAIYVQLEDLRDPGDAESYANVDLDANGSGTLTIYAGYSYHLHGSHWVSYGNDWCSKPVMIPAGTEPVNVRFVMNRKDISCEIREIDKLKN